MEQEERETMNGHKYERQWYTVAVHTVGGTVVYCGGTHRMGYSGILWWCI